METVQNCQRTKMPRRVPRQLAPYDDAPNCVSTTPTSLCTEGARYHALASARAALARTIFAGY